MLRNTVDEQSNLLQNLTTNERHHSDLLADMTKARDMLSMDKSYLQRELGEVTTAAHEHSRKVDTQQIHIEKLDAKILELTDQLVHVQMSTRTAFDERMEKEVNRLRLDYDKDMSSIKDTSKEISDHENRILREIRLNLEKDLEIVRQKLDDKTTEVNSMTRELADVRSATESEDSMLRAEMKMKHFEVTSLGATFEERSGQLKLAQLDLDILREEVSVHKTALLKMESERDSKCNRLEEDLARAYETIHAYDVLFRDDSHNDNDLMLKEHYRSRSSSSDGGKGDGLDRSRALSVSGGGRGGGGGGGRVRTRTRSGSDSLVDEGDEYSDEDWEQDELDEAEGGGEGGGGREGTSARRRSSGEVSRSDTGAVDARSGASRGGFSAPSTTFGRSKSGRQHSLSVLISNPRKFRQLLDTSERNLETIAQLQQHIRELEVKNTHLLKDKKKLKEEISRNIRELSLVPKSNKHIIDLYTQKDDECRVLHNKLSSLEAERRESQQNLEVYLQQNASLKNELKTLIEERKELHELKAMLVAFNQQTGGDGSLSLSLEGEYEEEKEEEEEEEVEEDEDGVPIPVQQRLTSDQSFTQEQVQVICW